MKRVHFYEGKEECSRSPGLYNNTECLAWVSSVPIYLILATPVGKAKFDIVCERKASVQTDLPLLRCGE